MTSTLFDKEFRPIDNILPSLSEYSALYKAIAIKASLLVKQSNDAYLGKIDARSLLESISATKNLIRSARRSLGDLLFNIETFEKIVIAYVREKET